MKPLRIKNARRKFSVLRDDAGVPHINARSWPDALYGLGYMHAMDRPTQMLFGRAVAEGRGAELISDSPSLLETDRFFRQVGLYLNLDREVDALDDVIFGQLTAYCQGVNDGLSQNWRSLPMWATGFQVQPWNQRSVLLIGNLLSFGGLTIGQQQNERLLLDLIQTGVCPDKLREMFSPLLDNADIELLRDVKIRRQLTDEALELITDLPHLAGSNAWAVRPERSASGHALLASDPHLEVNRLPAIWYEAVLEWEDRWVMGATLAGCPLFSVARTADISWGVTYLKGDNCDYFIEDCRIVEDASLAPSATEPTEEKQAETSVQQAEQPALAADAPLTAEPRKHPRRKVQYRRGDQWHDFQVRSEVILRKGKEASEKLDVLHNPQGTLEGDPLADGDGRYLLGAWTGDAAGVGQSIAVWLRIVDSRTTLEALDTIRQCPQPTLSWVVADRQGHIGRQANGCFPRRAEGHDGLIPVPAWEAKNHWNGFLPESCLPREYDPPEGYIVAANEDCNPATGPRLITLPVTDYRKRRIAERLAELPAATIEDMQKLQYDVISLQARDLLAVFLPHMPEGDIKEKLSAWNYNYEPSSVEPTIFQRLYRRVLLEIFGTEDDRGGGLGWRRMLYLSSRVGFSNMVLACIDRLLLQEESLWWNDKGEMIARAAAALEAEESDFQPWAAINAFSFTNRFVESELVGRALGIHTGEFPMPGCHATPFQGHLLRVATRETTFAPSYHFVADMGESEAWTNLPGGPSESLFSRFYKNDIPLWISGSYKRLRLSTAD